METDTWRPVAKLQMLRQRAVLYQRIREFFVEADVLEVETPILSSSANTDPHLHSLAVSSQSKYLQTSPEFAMKRLLASGTGSIFQICKVFRQGESGKRHNPEFTMLEWYRLGFDHFQLMEEVTHLVSRLIGKRLVESHTYRDVFFKYLGFDPHSVSLSELSRIAKEKTGYCREEGGEDKNVLLDLLMSHSIEPQLGQGCLTFIYNYPASQCALAQVVEDEFGVRVAERFELYVEGTELANGYHELTDADEQKQRFIEELKKRKQLGLEQLPQDNHLVAALAHGLPECAGVAIGVDRLLMLATGVGDIKDVLAFPDSIA